jgi:hypothetical protein
VLAVLTFSVVPALAATHIQLGVIGVAFAQTVRFHVVDLTPFDPKFPPPCRVQIALLDRNGKPVVDARGVPAIQEGTLLPGKSLTLVFNPAGLLRLGQRMAVREQVTLPDDTDVPPDPCDQVVPSLEITDNFTARTDAFISPGEIAGFNPQPDPPDILRVQFDFALVGLAFGQRARLHVAGIPGPTGLTNLKDPDATCHLTLTFRDAQGNVSLDAKRQPVTVDVDIPAGGSTQLTFDPAGLLRIGQRLLTRAEVVSPVELPPPCRLFTADVEVIDSFTARSSHFVSPAEIHGFNPQPDPPGFLRK